MNQPEMALVETLISPIQGADTSCGEDIRYEPEFEQVENEISKLTSIHKDQKTDWKIVESVASELLCTRTKDIRLLCWYLVAVRKNQGILKFPFIFTALFQFTQAFWQSGYPSKPKIKLAALNWLLAQLADEFVPFAEQATTENQQILLDVLDQLDTCLGDILGDDAPFLAPYRQQIAEVRQRQKMDTNTTTAPAAAAASQGTPSPSTPSLPTSLITSSSVSNDADLQRIIRGVQDQTRLLIQHIAGKDSSDPRSYLLAQTCAWLQVAAMPVANAEGITPLKPLTANKLQDYQQRIQAKEYAAVLPELLISLSKAPFWLDGHRWCAEALDALGFQELATLNQASIQAFVRKFPALPDFKFDNGVPFADEETKNWLQSSSALVPSASVAIESSSTESGEPWAQALLDAETAVREKPGSLKVALQQLQQSALSAHSTRERAFWLLALVTLCQQQQRHDLALAILEQLADMVRQYHLENWEPALAREIYQRWLLSLEKIGSKPHLDQIAEIKTTLYRMDISTAF